MYKIDNRKLNSITKDGHTMFIEDVVKDLNYYSSKYDTQQVEIDKLKANKKEMVKALHIACADIHRGSTLEYLQRVIKQMETEE